MIQPLRLWVAAGLSLAAWSVAGLAYAIPEPLSASNPIEIADDGTGKVTGTVSTGHEAYRFDATAGEEVTLDVNVLQILEGAEYTDDDSQLFLFDSNGALVAENDDQDDMTFESLIENYVIPEDGTYYVVVTTWDNDPVLGDDEIVTSWGENGSSSFEYELVVEKKTGADSDAAE